MIDWHILGQVAVHSFVIYSALIVGLRSISRRQLGQLTPLDLLIVLFLGSAVETALINQNTTLYAGLTSAATLILTNKVVAILAHKYKWFQRIICNGPALLIKDGHVIEETAKRCGMTHADLEAAIRQREIAELAEVRYAVLEEDGTINVIRRSSHSVA